jgi:hypothetical protein
LASLERALLKVVVEWELGRMRRFGAGLALAIFVSGMGTGALAKDAPLFSAMQTFCLLTGAKPAAVKAAVEAAGGLIETPTTSTSFPIPMSVTIWKVTYAGQPLRVTSGVQRAPGQPALNSESCTVDEFIRDKASVANIANWLAVKPTVFRNEIAVDFFMFEFVGDQSRAAPSENDAFLKDREEGRIWQLTLSQSAKGESAQLMHFQPDAEAH